MTGRHVEELKNVALVAQVRIERLAERVQAGDVGLSDAAAACSMIADCVQGDLAGWFSRYERDVREVAT